MKLKEQKEEKSLKLKTFRTLQYYVTCILDRNSCNGMFSSMHDFIS